MHLPRDVIDELWRSRKTVMGIIFLVLKFAELIMKVFCQLLCTLKHRMKRKECQHIITTRIDQCSFMLLHNVSHSPCKRIQFSRELLMLFIALFSEMVDGLPHVVTISMQKSIVGIWSGFTKLLILIYTFIKLLQSLSYLFSLL